MAGHFNTSVIDKAQSIELLIVQVWLNNIPFCEQPQSYEQLTYTPK